MEKNVLATPESCGISSSVIEAFVRRLDADGFATHSLLLSRGGQIFYEGYWKPFDENTHHRLNSVTKSFVGVAVGLLIEEGRLHLNDKLSSFFPDKLPEGYGGDLDDVTIEDLLKMRTAAAEAGGHWVLNEVHDRIKRYFSCPANRPAGTLFHYDSTGSFLLCVIVEKLTGMTFVDYLKQKILTQMGFDDDTVCIRAADGYSWGDSGLCCRIRDLHTFARFVMDKGVYHGKRLMNAAFLEKAVSRLTDTCEDGWNFRYEDWGYGYQIWKMPEDGFAFLGMGDQLVFAFPKQDFIFVMNADNQGNGSSRAVIFDRVRHDILPLLSDPLPENPSAKASLDAYTATLSLVAVAGERTTPYRKELDRRTIVLGDNPMGIKWLRFDFADGQTNDSVSQTNDSVSASNDVVSASSDGVLVYENRQGEKRLPFGICRNVITAFPEDGYPDMDMLHFEPDNHYPCAVSAAFAEERKLSVRVQMIGRHLGMLYIAVTWREDGRVSVLMRKNTNCFLKDYNGYAIGQIDSEA